MAGSRGGAPTRGGNTRCRAPLPPLRTIQAGAPRFAPRRPQTAQPRPPSPSPVPWRAPQRAPQRALPPAPCRAARVGCAEGLINPHGDPLVVLGRHDLLLRRFDRRVVAVRDESAVRERRQCLEGVRRGLRPGRPGDAPVDRFLDARWIARRCSRLAAGRQGQDEQDAGQKAQQSRIPGLSSATPSPSRPRRAGSGQPAPLYRVRRPIQT